MPGQPEVDVPPRDCEDDKKAADSRLAVVIEDYVNISQRVTPSIQKARQVGDTSYRQVSVANQEDYSSRQIHPKCELSHDSHRQEAQFPFVVYILCDQLKNGTGNALIDTGSQVSLVAETDLARGLKIKKQVVQIRGIPGTVMETKGQTDLRVEETLLVNSYWWRIYL